ncbi:MAG: hypothetical protein AAF571_12065 [Verrucomicrobiota bacterium]
MSYAEQFGESFRAFLNLLSEIVNNIATTNPTAQQNLVKIGLLALTGIILFPCIILKVSLWHLGIILLFLIVISIIMLGPQISTESQSQINDRQFSKISEEDEKIFLTAGTRGDKDEPGS